MHTVTEALECRDRSVQVLRSESFTSISKARKTASAWAKERKLLPGYFVAGSASRGFYEFGSNDFGRVYGTITVI